jgi:hypothetical protein
MSYGGWRWHRVGALVSFFMAITAACVGTDADTTPAPDAGTGPDTGGVVESGAPTDASVDTAIDTAVDVQDAGFRCDPDTPFITNVAVGELNGNDFETAVTLTPDERYVILSSSRPTDASNNYTLFVASRASTDASFGPVDPLFPTDNNIYAAASLSPSGLTLFGSSSVFSQVWRTDRGSTDASFPNPTMLYLQQARWPHVSADGKTLYVGERVVTDGGEHSRIVSYDTASFTVRKTYATLDLGTTAGSYEAAPVLSPDELTIYFAEFTASPENFDIYVARRKSKDDGFGIPRRVDELSGTAEDTPGWLSPDGCRLYFIQNRDIHLATKPM